MKNINSNSFDVAGFGITTLDYICLVNKIADYSRPAEISDIKYLGGGCVSTALVTVQRLGGQTSIISSLGNDWVGKEIIKEFDKEKIDYYATEIINGVASTFSFIQVSKKLGNRAIAFFPGSGSFLRFSEKAKEVVGKSKMLILDGLQPEEDIKAALFARENNIKVMLDCNMLIKGTKELLPFIDYLITSESFLYSYSKSKNVEESIKILGKDYEPSVLITTLGKNGSVALVNNELIKCGIYDVKVKDTTGCGDVYHGAFLFGLLKNWDILDIMKFATAVSSIKCMHYGGRPGIPDFNATISFLKEFGVNIKKYM